MLIVKKFGGTSVGNKERILNVAKRCIEDYQKGNDVVVVLSAMGKSTDELIDMAKDINPTPSKREMDMLMTTGEQVSVSLMAMAMGSLGVPAISLNAFQVAMHTTHRYGNAQLKRIDTDRIRNELEQRKIVLVTGFQGIDKFDNVTTLGRGGSDTTAVALAAALHADATGNALACRAAGNGRGNDDMEGADLRAFSAGNTAIGTAGAFCYMTSAVAGYKSRTIWKFLFNSHD